MDDIHIRKDGHVGRITLNRPKALNALTYAMCLEIEKVLDIWSLDDDIHLLLLDAEGEKAFCAGGDIVEMYETGTAGDYEYGRRFWRDEYRMNAKMFEFPKPVVTFLQGFTMGGGVGVGCHGSHRIVCETSKIAMPEVGIGLVPDVGGSLILARAPGRIGEYLGTTAARMGPADAILAGFADYYIPFEHWERIKAALVNTGDLTLIDEAATVPEEGELSSQQTLVDRHFSGETLGDILRSLRSEPSDFATKAQKLLDKNSPLSMACAIELIHRQRVSDDIRSALEMEYRFTFRAMEHGDFLEGIRAAVIDKDRQPNWRHSLDSVPGPEITKMLMPLGEDTLHFEEDPS